MAARPIEKSVVQAVIKRLKPFTHLSFEEACRAAGLSAGTIKRYGAEYAPRFGLTWPVFAQSKYNTHRPRIVPAEAHVPIAEVRVTTTEAPPSIEDELTAALKKAALSLDVLANRFAVTPGRILDTILELKKKGTNLLERDGKWLIDKDVQPSFLLGPVFEYTSRPDNTFVFGATSDNHLGSKYERLDVLNDLYDRFAAHGVDRVFNAGNWIDGEARFNKFDLHTHGMDAQLRYLAKEYPQRNGLITYAVAGDDHEGWYTQREGVNIGQRAEQTMRQFDRKDWVDLGYMESHIKLINANSGAYSILACVHPGGGSAYALSYSIQKIIESLDGGEKPAVGLYGHYHKLWAGNIRNVWCLQTGCTEDQTPFMRKKKLEAHVGGSIVEMEQDPKTGAIIGFMPKMMRYFNRSFYANGRWSHSDDVVLADRGAK